MHVSRTTLGAAVAVLIVTGSLAGCSRFADDHVPPAPTRHAEAEPDEVTTGVSSPETMPEPVATAPAADRGAASAAAGRASGGTGSYRYVVATGDAIQGIAARFGLCTVDLYRANPGVQGHEIVAGQTLLVERRPGPGHTDAECDDPNPAAAGG